MIPAAFDALEESGIAKGGSIEKSYRGAVSSFGAAVAMGSLLSAAAFFQQNGNASYDRKNLLKAIFRVIRSEGGTDGIAEGCLYDYVKNHPGNDTQKLVMDAAVAVKLAMNLYELK